MFKWNETESHEKQFWNKIKKNWKIIFISHLVFLFTWILPDLIGNGLTIDILWIMLAVFLFYLLFWLIFSVISYISYRNFLKETLMRKQIEKLEKEK
jgi:hypothetical protein